MASTVRYAAPPPPTGHALSRPHAGARADAIVPDDSSDSESVAESSCPGPYSRRPSAGGNYNEEDDGCSSCVEGRGLGCYEEAEDEEEEEEEVSTASVWWKKRLAAGEGCVFPPAEVREEAEDPERAAARQAEDRKFWEDCLGTGYP